MKCRHENVNRGEPRPFFQSVAMHPYTAENRAAHGFCTHREKCIDCGNIRMVVTNGGHEEFGPWGIRSR